MSPFTFCARSESDTDRLGAALADLLPGGTVVALCGTLGAGKTRLVRAIAAGFGVPREQVVSPTFVLCQQYEGRITIHHLDAYRIRDDDEFLQLGPEEYFESSGITIVEWADRVARCLPPDVLRIRIEVTGEHTRTFRLEGCSEPLLSMVEQLRRLSESA